MWPRVETVTFDKKIKIIAGTANPMLAQEIADYLGISLLDCKISRFRDGEVNLRINETVRGAEVYIVQPTGSPAAENLMELLIIIDACRRASAKEIAAVIPYYGYARQDRKTQPRDPICAKLVANLLTAAGADRVLTMDLHAGQIQGFFDIPVDNLLALPIIAKYLMEKDLGDIVVVAPDVGGVGRARELAHRLDGDLAIVDKRRPKANVAEAMHIIGDVEGKVAILVDDIIDTGGTIVQAANLLLKEGAKEVYACCSHPVFSPPATERLAESGIKEVVVTNSIPLSEEKRTHNMVVLSVAPLFGEAIRRIYLEQSVSRLFI
ncbi:MAG: ribose-phosphate pyrophosphokinase [Limnochordia bacterium]|jgi:ribose-phosphate pyrophosphokinase|nr:ribose-phosphate pyrophosphokinase [Limnochordia bacterium]